jgi:hypothetical protein
MHKVRFILILFLFSLIQGSVTHAQWVQTNGPYDHTIYSFAVIGTNLFAGTDGGGVWRRPISDIINEAKLTKSH